MEGVEESGGELPVALKKEHWGPQGGNVLDSRDWLHLKQDQRSDALTSSVTDLQVLQASAKWVKKVLEKEHVSEALCHFLPLHRGRRQ